MKYYIIVGEASGDLHASHLMKAIKKEDPDATFRFSGGDMMTEEGGTRIAHYKNMAYMGFLPVLLHLPTIIRNMKRIRQDIIRWQPDALILVDYPSFNLKLASHIKKHTSIPICYYISPKIWAWKEYRIKQIKRYIDRLYSILPFEKAFYEQKHDFPIEYVGNPSANEIQDFLQNQEIESLTDFLKQNKLPADKPIIALLAGSRQQEIKANLPAMIQVAKQMDNYRFIIAGAPSIPIQTYHKYIKNTPVSVLCDQTYRLLIHSTAALVTSGTATLETALLRIPQIVCYKTPLPFFYRWGFKHLIKVKYISLVNLIADETIVPELFADEFSVENIKTHLEDILPGNPKREEQLEGYKTICQKIGSDDAATNTAQAIITYAKSRQS